MQRRVKASLVSIGADIILITVKMALAALTGSVALLADAYHSLSDLFISGTILTSSLLRSRMEKKRQMAVQTPVETPAQTAETPQPPVEDPGEWIDTTIAYVVSLVVLCLPFTIVGGLSGRTPIETRFLWVAVIGLALCIAIAHFLARFKIIAGKETDSPALVADGYHSRTDMFTSIAVLFSLIGRVAGIDIDSLVAVIIAGLIAVTGLDLLVTTVIGDITKHDARRFSLWVWGVEKLAWGIGALLHSATRGRVNLDSAEWLKCFSPRSLLSRKAIATIFTATMSLYIFSGLHFITPGETGVRLRFGRIVDAALPPGVVWMLPQPFERIERARPQEVRRVEVGFRTSANLISGSFPLIWDTTHTIRGYEKMREESIVVTGDENLVDIAMVLQYRPIDTLTTAYRINRMDEVMRGLLESAMRTVMAVEKSEELLGVERLRALKAVTDALEHDVRELKLGIEIVSLLYHDLHPPVEVVPAFRAVFSAREEKAQAINSAQSHANEAIPKARATAAQEKADAESQALTRIHHATGDALRFSQVAVSFGRAPDISSYRLYIETMEEGLAGKEKIVADPTVNRGEYRLWRFAPGELSKKNTEKMP